MQACKKLISTGAEYGENGETHSIIACLSFQTIFEELVRNTKCYIALVPGLEMEVDDEPGVNPMVIR